jgi:hypothetical protein
MDRLPENKNLTVVILTTIDGILVGRDKILLFFFYKKIISRKTNHPL